MEKQENNFSIKNREFIEKFLNFIISNNNSKNTVVAYRSDLEQFHQINNYENFLYDVENKINNYISTLYKNKLSHTSLARKLSTMKSFYRFLHEENIIDVFPLTKFISPQIKRPLLKTLQKNEISDLINKVMLMENGINLVWPLMHGLLEFLYSSGARISEALSLQIYKIFDTRGQIVNEVIIKGKGGKERILFLNHTCQESILKFLFKKFATQDIKLIQHSKEYLFSLGYLIIRNNEFKTKPISRQRVYQVLKQLATKVGINPNRVSPHVFRHSIAIHLLLNDKHRESNNIRLLQEFLGHKSINTTQIYINYSDHNRLSKILNKSHPLNKI